MKFRDVYNKKYEVWCDMDGVLVNFKNAIEKLGLTIKKLDDEPNKAWPIIAKAGENFWSQAPWTNDGKELWDYVKKYNPTILSAPSQANSSKTGKRIWVKNELGQNVKVILCKAAEKQQYANYKSILIDDMEKNIDQWVANGGVGILHKSAKETIKKLQDLGL
jgi:hypothetical protein